MSLFGQFLGAVATGVDTLADFDRRAALNAGVHPKRVRDWERVHEVYFGATRWTKQQRVAADKARAHKVSIDKLVLIEERLSRIDDPATRWRLRHDLLEVGGTYDTVKRRAKDLVPHKEPVPPQDKVAFSGSKLGKRTVTITADERAIADLEHAVSRRLDSTRPIAPQLHDAFWRLLRGDAGVTAAVPRPIVVVPLPAYTSILRQEGNETVLGLTDGTTMTGAEFLALHHGRELEVALFHPQEGPVNLYRGQRFANQKQRDLVRTATTSCTAPDCRHGSDACEIHHVTAWKHGGPTNLNNLAPLCRFHNRMNDDDPHRNRRANGRSPVDEHRRGHIAFIRGAPVWISPQGYAVPNERHRYGAMHCLFG